MYAFLNSARACSLCSKASSSFCFRKTLFNSTVFFVLLIFSSISSFFCSAISSSSPFLTDKAITPVARFSPSSSDDFLIMADNSSIISSFLLSLNIVLTVATRSITSTIVEVIKIIIEAVSGMKSTRLTIIGWI
ncbi:hypothetical protein SDC9_206198 [bioreactor metagenome]|uniref:Uncharacterized protein n=1 Tax=bioreactor metagenome TaxID=1076179 RepID=A0A645JFX0_9ZZZZ